MNSQVDLIPRFQPASKALRQKQLLSLLRANPKKKLLF
jgi:hypothetical protein